jgi:hypothetical protein
MKSYLQELPTLSSPEKGQPLILCISAMHAAVSGALMVKKRDCQQRQTNEAAIPSVLHIGGPHRVQKILFINGEDLLCYDHEDLQALTLFRSTHNQSANQPTAE